MEKFVLIIHSLAALVIIGLVLLQQGKGAAAGASFGAGASQTVFGSEGSGNFFTRATWVIAFLFFATSFGLAVIAKNHSKVATQGLVVPAVQQAPVSDVPATSAAPASDIPAATTAPAAPSDVPAVESQAAPADAAQPEEKKE
ncbi:preprotein translocase subunit SecG [Cellvibrio mixtus]|uniref:preprotein translocase subunit SecG n=1 Tax=Cellvibrio mixtus TaxID=39650 RepID=UPI000586AD24|nr:preprotein translocase subunit SecG [Cellvibrio mixtus]